MRWVVALGLLVAACGGESAASTTVPVERPSTTITTVAEATSTTAEASSVVDIPGRGLQWEVGSTYVTDRFLVPLEFRPQEAGWRSLGVDVEWVHLAWSESDAEGVTLVVAAHLPFEPIEVVAESVVDDFDVEARADPVEVEVGGWPALLVDVEAPPNRVPQDSECDFQTGRVGIAPDRYALGFGSCSVSRVWVVNVGGTAVTVVGSTFETERFDELIGRVERLLSSMEFVGS